MIEPTQEKTYMEHTNYRVLAHQDSSNHLSFAIYLVKYRNGVPVSHDEYPTLLKAYSLESLEWAANLAVRCLQSPILWYGDRFPQHYEPLNENNNA